MMKKQEKHSINHNLFTVMRKIRMMAIGAILSVCGIGTTALAQEASE